jgi:hypothetical protein
MLRHSRTWDSQSRPRSEMRTRNVNRYAVTSDDARFIMYGWNTEGEKIADCSLSQTSAGLQLSGDPGRSFSCLSDKRWFMLDLKWRQMVGRSGVLVWAVLSAKKGMRYDWLDMRSSNESRLLLHKGRAFIPLTADRQHAAVMLTDLRDIWMDMTSHFALNFDQFYLSMKRRHVGGGEIQFRAFWTSGLDTSRGQLRASTIFPGRRDF